MINEQLTLDDIIAKTLDALEGAGLKNTTLWSYSRHYASLRIFFRQHECRGYDLSLIEAFLAENEKRYRNGEIAHYYHTHLKRSIKILVEYEAGGTLLSVFERKGTRFTLNEEFESILSEYLSENTFHPNTQDDIVWAVRRFMYFLEQSGHYSFRCINDQHVRKFMLAMSERLASGSLKNMMCYLREFSKFVARKGYSDFDMAALFSVRIRRESKIYPVMSDKELELILKQVDTKTDMGKRDMAMLMLAATTGLRAIDIVNMKLQDIDWLRGEIKLVQRKTLIPVILPLMPEAGEAIKEYILFARPKSDSEYIFLTTKYPIRKFTDDTTFGYMFGKYQRMAGIERKPFDGKGFHSIRRRIATKMIVSGVPVTTIANVLGPLNIESSKQYLSFDTENLRECALSLKGIEMPGGESDV